MRRRESLTLDMTPLVDVVFLLLIFFLVTSVFKKEELALLLNLPAGEQGERATTEKSATIQMDEERIAFNDRVVTLEELDKELAALPDKSVPVVVRIDRNVEYGRIVKLFDLLKKHGLNNLALIEKPNR